MIGKGGGEGNTLAWIKRVAREKEWTRMDDDDDRAKRLEEDGGRRGREGRAFSGGDPP